MVRRLPEPEDTRPGHQGASCRPDVQDRGRRARSPKPAGPAQRLERAWSCRPSAARAGRPRAYAPRPLRRRRALQDGDQHTAIRKSGFRIAINFSWLGSSLISSSIPRSMRMRTGVLAWRCLQPRLEDPTGQICTSLRGRSRGKVAYNSGMRVDKCPANGDRDRRETTSVLGHGQAGFTNRRIAGSPGRWRYWTRLRSV